MNSEVLHESQLIDRRLGLAATVLLWLMFGCFVTAHLFPGRLDPIHHVISQYASRAPLGTLITGCMIFLGLLSAVLGFRLALRFHQPPYLLSGMLLFCALLPLRYTAAYRALSVVEPQRAPYWWEFWKSSPGPNPWNDAIAFVHAEVIRDACGAITLAMIAFALASRKTASIDRGPAAITLLLGTSALISMFLRIPFKDWQGLWQRLGFACIVGWLIWLNAYLSRARQKTDATTANNASIAQDGTNRDERRS